MEGFLDAKHVTQQLCIGQRLAHHFASGLRDCAAGFYQLTGESAVGETAIANKTKGDLKKYQTP